MTTQFHYPIGTPGVAWGEAERTEWLSRQTRRRSYETDVLGTIGRLRPRFDVVQYGQLDYGPSDTYPLFAIKRTERTKRADAPARARRAVPTPRATPVIE